MGCVCDTVKCPCGPRRAFANFKPALPVLLNWYPGGCTERVLTLFFPRSHDIRDYGRFLAWDRGEKAT